MTSGDGDPGQVDVGGGGGQAGARVDDARAAVLPGGRGLYLDCQAVRLPPPLLNIGPGCRPRARAVAH